MKGKHCLLLLLILGALLACNDPKPVTDALHRAEALMNEHPDSAWAVLNTLSPDEMGQNRTRALYALLYTQAQDKTYRDETNDSLISIAVDYYRHTDDARRKFLSYYYKGRVHFNAKDYLSATTCYMEAEQLADDVSDDYLVGLLYSELGRIYRLYYDYPKSLEAYQKAAECYERAGKTRHRNYMWYNQSSVLRNINEYNESERLLRMTLGAGKNEKDKILIELCLGNLVMLCIEQNRMNEAKEFYAELELLMNDDYVSPSFIGSLIEIYAAEGQFLQAVECVEKGWKRVECRTDSINLYVSSSKLYSQQGRNDLAYQALLKAMTLQNEDVKQALKQPVLTAQRDYLSEKLMFEEYRRQVEERLNLLYILVSVLVLVVAMFVFVWILKKYKKESRQVISDLEKEKAKVIKEKDGISLQLQQLEADKKKAAKMIEELKDEIAQNEKESNERITELLQKLDSNKEESNRFITELKEELADKIKESDCMAALFEVMEHEKVVASQMIQDLNNQVSQKEESRTKMAVLVQKLENDNKLNAVTIASLRKGLEQHAAHAAELFRAINSDMSELFVVVKEKKVVVPGICKVVYRWRDDYFVGKKSLDRLERMVNYYCDDAMSYFRQEVILGDEEHYQRVCYWFSGVSIKAVALLMDESKENVYQRRLRLREKIDSSDYSHKQIYLKLLGK